MSSSECFPQSALHRLLAMPLFWNGMSLFHLDLFVDHKLHSQNRRKILWKNLLLKLCNFGSVYHHQKVVHEQDFLCWIVKSTSPVLHHSCNICFNCSLLSENFLWHWCVHSSNICDNCSFLSANFLWHWCVHLQWHVVLCSPSKSRRQVDPRSKDM